MVTFVFRGACKMENIGKHIFHVQKILQSRQMFHLKDGCSHYIDCSCVKSHLDHFQNSFSPSLQTGIDGILSQNELAVFQKLYFAMETGAGHIMYHLETANFSQRQNQRMQLDEIFDRFSGVSGNKTFSSFCLTLIQRNCAMKLF